MANPIVLPDGYTLEDCLNILRSPKPNETEMKKCIDAGVRLSVEECNDMCVPGKIVNGYVFNTCMQHHGIIFYKYIVDRIFSTKKKYVNGKNVNVLPFNPSFEIKYRYGLMGNDILGFTDARGVIANMRGNRFTQVYIVRIYDHSQVFMYDMHEYTANMFDLAFNHPISTESLIHNLNENDILSMSELVLKEIINHIDPAKMNKKVCIKIISCSTYSSFEIKNPIIISALEKFVKSLKPKNLLKLISVCSFCLYYLPKEIFTETFCRWILEYAYKNMDIKNKDVLKVKCIYIGRTLNKRMVENKTTYSEKFIMECITKYKLSIDLLPASSVTLEIFTELCKYKHIIGHVYADARFEQFITKEACIKNIKSKRVSFNTIPHKFKTQDLYALQNKCKIDKFCEYMKLDNIIIGSGDGIYFQDDDILLDTHSDVDDAFKIYI